VIGKMRDTVPQYEALPGLAFKAFALTQADGQFGGISLWQDPASAQARLGAAWQERVQKAHGAPAHIEWFDAPILLPSKLADTKVSVPGL
jgi:hypothetical protein